MRSISTRFTGLLLVALGVWGGLVPFVGHYFHFALGPDKAWSWTTGRLYLDILPGVATVLGGLNLMSAGPRRSARLGALLALAGGIWFTIGPEISQLWHAGGAQGAGHGSAHIQMLEMLTYHTGLGVLIAALAAYALPRFPAVEEVAAPERARRERDGTVVAGGAAAGAGVGAAGADRPRHWYREPDGSDEPAAQREGAAVDAEGATRAHPVAGRESFAGREPMAERESFAGREPMAERESFTEREPVAEREPFAERGMGGAAGEPVAERGMAGADREPVAERDRLPSATDPAAADATVATRSAWAGAYSSHSNVRRRRGGLLGNLLRR